MSFRSGGQRQSGSSQGRASVEESTVTLQIELIKASNLYDADGVMTGKSDPYCICFIPGKEKSSKVQTQVINNDLNPVWNFKGELKGFHGHNDTLEVQVWDSDWGNDTLLGKTVIHASELNLQSGGVQDSLPLSDCAHAQGEVTVKITLPQAAVSRTRSDASSAAAVTRMPTAGEQTKAVAAPSMPQLPSAAVAPERPAQIPAVPMVRPAAPVSSVQSPNAAGYPAAVSAHSMAVPDEVVGGFDSPHHEATIDLGEEPDAEAWAAHAREGLALFEMLDRDQRDSLIRRDARAWFRGLGWCLHDAELDALLDEVAASTEQNAGARTPQSPSANHRWVLSQLLDLSERHRHLCGPDPDSLRKSLFDIVGGFHSVSKDAFRRQVANCEVGLTENDVEELLDLCGYPGMPVGPTHTLELDAIAQAMTDTICNPRVPAHRGARAGGVIRQPPGKRY